MKARGDKNQSKNDDREAFKGCGKAIVNIRILVRLSDSTRLDRKT